MGLGRAPHSWIFANVAFGSRLCENSGVELARRNFVSITLNRNKNSTGSRSRTRKREKTILRILCSRTFSHSLDPKATLANIQECGARPSPILKGSAYLPARRNTIGIRGLSSSAPEPSALQAAAHQLADAIRDPDGCGTGRTSLSGLHRGFRYPEELLG